MTDDITSHIIAILDDHGMIPLGGAVITEATHLDSLGMDALDAAELACAIEIEFSVDMPDDWVIMLGIDWDQAQVSHLAAYVGQRVGAECQ